MFVFIYISNVNCFVFLVVDVKKSLQNPEIDATFSTISVITSYNVAVSFIGGGPGENHRPVTSH
jgi:hypothetical protein